VIQCIARASSSGLMAEVYWWRMGGKIPRRAGEKQAVQGGDPHR
jgi:hypothetical protein